MPFQHLVNCLALALGPPAVFFYSLKLREAFATASMLMVMMFVCSQAVQLALLATFAPVVQPGSDALGLELITALARGADCVAASLLFDQKRLKDLPLQTQVLLVGLVWAVGDTATSKLMTIWEAQSAQFNWDCLRVAAQANLVFATEVAFAAVVMVWTRRQPQEAMSAAAAVLCAARCALPLLWRLAGGAPGSDSGAAAFGAQFALTGAYVGACCLCYLRHCRTAERKSE
eukprot:TRINITY_DN25400_c0_g1_i1.p1 TRINITY_DN25400_c0_g1~~TRINITY_DN25400_c0_g1_i1.p1  ORF type:complete len:231 (+),score=69.69 TRINITY_DN25400_c0_g1_i1:96-788(+)